ncbi:lipoprotein signal peptidase [Aridibaculum aurantiacum]|uniref:lipoprotein signal peptidase n=1 Tax=Aridibaculum aurantiacum TaxID=2810307 RepID=UPI001A96BDA2
MKSRNIILLVILVLLIDQVSKFYIKTNFYIGQEIKVMGMNWFRIHFVENEGMAWGWKWGGDWGKVALTLFRLVAVIAGVFIIRDFIKKKYHPGFVYCAALIFAGALGNLIDSLFYGMIFSASDPYVQNVATLFPAGGGYANFLHGKVVDMLYFPIITNAHFPSWVPFWGGEEFEFFRPVFNVADAAISVGVIIILIFQNKFFKQEEKKQESTVETNAPVDDNVQVL